MNIETKYSFGDKVYTITNEQKKVSYTCSFCEKGKIVGKDDEVRDCPECYGKTDMFRWENEGWRVGDLLTIGEIRVETRVADKVGQDPGTIFTNYGPQDSCYKETYMCKETGIGSGSLHCVDRLWPTKIEAQTECDKRNAEDVAV